MTGFTLAGADLSSTVVLKGQYEKKYLKIFKNELWESELIVLFS